MKSNCDVYLGVLVFMNKIICLISNLVWFEVGGFENNPLEKILYGRLLDGASFKKVLFSLMLEVLTKIIRF